MDGYHLNNGLPHYSTSQSNPSESNTLPPINGMPMPYQNVYQQAPPSLPHTPLTPHTPLSSASSAPTSTTAYSQIAHSAPPRTLQPHPSQQPPVSGYTTQSILTPPSTSIAPPTFYSPAQLGSRPTDILPRPSDGPPLSQYAPQQLASQPNALAKQLEPEPTHVVGQQGRRGILPSAPGRPPPASGKPVVPQKDAEGKFPCPNCTKTYLHAKHLKRHMLRHTGDRPYQCKLCKDTFSRSDILKRHFQKCSIRRGTPGDTDHLEGARLHTNKNRLSANVNNQNYLNGVPSQDPGFDPTGMSNPMVGGLPGFQMPGQPVYEGMTPMSNRTSRASSIMQPPTSMAENRRSLSGLEHLGASRPPSYDGSEFGATTLSSSLSHGIPAYAMPPMHPGGPMGPHQYGGYAPVSSAEMTPSHQMRPNGANENLFPRSDNTTVNGEQHGLGWNPAYQSSAPEGYGGGMSANGNGVDNSYLYSNSSTLDSSQMFDRWDLGNPLAQKAEQLVKFCYPHGTADAPEEQAHEAKLRSVLTVDNVRTFIQLFSHFHGHWPIIHVPTFNPTEAYDGLLLSICTIGAIYHDRLQLLEVRWLMELAQNAIHRAIGFDQTGALRVKSIEEMQALILLQITSIWHGNHSQRQESRLSYWKLADAARRNHLLQPLPPSDPSFSILHHGSETPSQGALSSWKWESWVAQEKRSRAMFFVYLIDCALVMYFNHEPLFDPSEVHLQLPCDDAAWEATSSEECAKALGLCGKEVQAIVNTAGSRGLKQPDFAASLQALLSPGYTFAPRATNIWAKFILSHALHTQIWLTLHQRQLGPSAANSPALSGPWSRPTTPLQQYGWVMPKSPAARSGTSSPASGHFAPPSTMASLSQRQTLPVLASAVAKLKEIWYRDLDLQYPSTGTTPNGTQIRRVGFCRDGEHFIFLAEQFLKQSGMDQTGLDADQRFQWVFRLLKQIRRAVGNRDIKAGKEIGAVVDMKEEYGDEDLTLDMKLLFAPLPNDAESPMEAMLRHIQSPGGAVGKTER